MHELVKVNYESGQPTVLGREHEFLEKLDFQSFFIAVSELKLRLTSAQLTFLMRVVDTFENKYNVSAIAYLKDTLTMESLYKRECERNENKPTKKFLYLVGFTDDTVKIGVSVQPEIRVNAVSNQAGRNPMAHRIFSTPIPAINVETRFKAYFKKSLINGEVYNVGFDEAERYILSLTGTIK